MNASRALWLMETRRGKSNKERPPLLTAQEFARRCNLELYPNALSELREVAILFARTVKNMTQSEAAKFAERQLAKVPKTLQANVARVWLIQFGFKFRKHGKGAQIALGHERPEVVKYRNDFLKMALPLFARTRLHSFDAEEGIFSEYLFTGVEEFVHVSQDESMVHW